jgi:sugar phosphate isomerase/epimerase
MLASGASQEDIDYLDAEKLFLVLLADSINVVAPHFRVFPGEGEHNNDLAAWVTAFHRLGYRGDYSLAVFNDDYQQLPPPGVAQRAWGSALWLGQDVLQRSVPLPNQIRLKRRLAA